MTANYQNDDQINKLIDEATNLRNNGREQEAIDIYEEAMKKYQESGDIVRAADCAQMIGVCYKILKKNDEAFEWYDKAVELFEQVNNEVGLGNTQRDIGIMHEYYQRYNEALEWLEKSAETLQHTDDKNAYGVTLAKLGMIYTKLGELEKAESKLIQGLEVIRGYESRSWFMEMTTLLHFGELEYVKENFIKSIDYLRQSLGILSEEDQGNAQLRRKGQIHGGLAWNYLKLQDAQSATTQFKRAMESWAGMDSDALNVVFEEFKPEQFLKELAQKDGELAFEAEKAYGDII